MEHLETVEVDQVSDREKPFRMAVQWVNRPNLDFRGFSGQIATGTVRVGDPIRVLPSGKTSTVSRSEEHTSELQSLMRISYAVFCLKKKTTINKHRKTQNITIQY